MTTDHMEHLRVSNGINALRDAADDESAGKMVGVRRLDLQELLAAYDALLAGTTVKRGKKEYPAEFSAAYDAMKDAGAKWREGSTPAAAFKQWQARVKAGASPEQIMEGTLRYGAYIKATAGEPKMAQTFFGPGEHYTAAWEIKRTAPRRQLPDRREQQAQANQEALARLSGMPLFDPNTIDMESP